MRTRILILGGGTGGTIMANRLRRALPVDEVAITVVDRDDAHVYQPGLLFVPFGLADADHLVRPRHRQLHRDIGFEIAEIDRVETAANEVHLGDGRTLAYDVLIVATGARLVPEETEGMTGDGWLETVCPFYTLEGARRLAETLQRFDGGRILVNLVEMPIKCPVAPLEFAFLADWFLTEAGVRSRTDLVYVTPLDGAFTKPTASHLLGSLLETKHIELVSEFNTGEVDAATGTLSAYDGRQEHFDLLVTVPLHAGAAYVDRSPGLGAPDGFIPTDPHSLQAKAAPNVFAIGDATNLPTSKAGSVTHFEAEVLADNVLRFLRGEALAGAYDGHANCFIETGFHKALLIDFNYDVEPLPGHFPTEHVGLPLLRESRANHIGKLLFQQVYWHALLPGRDLPGIGSQLRHHATKEHA
jgi:sulfide:quinone oxidoreductase